MSDHRKGSRSAIQFKKDDDGMYRCLYARSFDEHDDFPKEGRLKQKPFKRMKGGHASGSARS